jgi:HEXXH motif-containing protein
VSTVLSDWPEVVLTFDSSVIFVVDVAIDGEWSSKNSGSSSTHLAEHLGAVFVTFYDPVGTACGCVHEMAHNKLMRLGVQMESSHKLILNDPCELFVSPVRKDKPRPMQAIMHAVYSFIHVTELLLRHVDSDSQRLNRMHSDRLRRLHDNLLPALDCLKQNVKTDMDGELFMKAFFSWADRVLEAALECSNKIPKL